MPSWLLPAISGGCVGLVVAAWVAKRLVIAAGGLLVAWICNSI